jgi:signal transduction histidine kinase
VSRIEFQVTEPKDADLALFIRRARDNYAVYVNGKLAAATPGILAERSTLHGFLPRLVKILPALLVSGQNTIDIVGARNGTQTVLREVYFGSAARLEPAYHHTKTVVHDSGEFAAFTAAIVLLFSLALASLIRNPALTIAIAITLALFLLRELHALWIDRPWPQTYRDIYLLLMTCSIWISVAAFVNEWTDGPHAYRRVFFAIAAIAWAIVIACYATLEDCHTAYVIGSHVSSVLGAAAMIFMARRLFRHYWFAPASTWAEIAVATIGLTMALASFASQSQFIPGLSQLASVEGDAFSKLGALSIIAFIAVGLARHGVRVYQLAAMNNDTLARQVREKERELEANHALLRDQERERTLTAERGRIMRDVHDGIGSQLLGLLVQARGGAAKPATMAAGLQAAIDDLYLVVDSLDGVDGSLETALGTFRTRIEPKCAAAGIDISWNVEDVSSAKALGPASVLQIYRILQEALSNAIRHGNPKRVAFSLRREKPGNVIALSLKDDGKGFDTSAKQMGRGLSNMRKRAASIGAQLDITSGEAGTCVKLLLPQ